MKSLLVEKYDNLEQILINQMISAYLPTIIQKESKDDLIENNSLLNRNQRIETQLKAAL